MTVNYIEKGFNKDHVNKMDAIYEKSTSYQEQYDQDHCEMNSGAAKAIAVVSYLTLIGWLVALFVFGHHKSSFATFHLRQSLGLILTGALLSLIPLVGWLLDLAVLAAWGYALVYAVKGVEKPVPLLGESYQQHLDFIK